MKLPIVLGIIGLITLVFATCISTVIIPAIDRKLSDVVESIDNLKYDLSMFRVEALGLDQMDDLITICRFERELFQVRDIPTLKRVDQIALEESVKLAEGWSALCSEDKSQEPKTKVKINNVLADLPEYAKFDKIQEICQKAKLLAFDRLRVKNEKLQKDKELREEIEKERSHWHNVFVTLQVVCLISLTLAGVIERITKMKTLNGDKK